MRSPATFTVHRSLTPRQQERRSRILEVAMELAAAGGYDAVTMQEISARSGVSLGTIYRYFSSKDHLLAEALHIWGRRLGARLRESPPRGATAAERVASVFRRMARGVEEAPQLGIALTTALLSRDPGAHRNRAGLTSMMQEWIDLAIGEAPVEDRETVIEILEDVCFANMVALVSGVLAPREIGERLSRTANRVLR